MSKKTKLESNIPNLDYGNLMKLKYDGNWVNYKQLCECLNIPYLTSNSKTKQLNELNAVCVIEKQGVKYKITEVRPKKEVFKEFDVEYNNITKSGVYKIYKDNLIYIGQTTNFLNRFRAHKYGDSEVSNLIKNGGRLKIVAIENDLIIRKQIEEKLIEKYSLNPKYNCLNKYLNRSIYTKKEKCKYLTIRINKSDIDKVKNLLDKNNIDYKE